MNYVSLWFAILKKVLQLSDLNRLMNLYQFWAHKLFPKIQFSDLVERVEKLCHSKRMHVRKSAVNPSQLPYLFRILGCFECLEGREWKTR